MSIILYTMQNKRSKKIVYGIGQEGCPIIMMFTEDGMQDYSLKDIDEMYDIVLIKSKVDPAEMVKNAMKS